MIVFDRTAQRASTTGTITQFECRETFFANVRLDADEVELGPLDEVFLDGDVIDRATHAGTTVRKSPIGAITVEQLPL